MQPRDLAGLACLLEHDNAGGPMAHPLPHKSYYAHICIRGSAGAVRNCLGQRLMLACMYTSQSDVTYGNGAGGLRP